MKNTLVSSDFEHILFLILLKKVEKVLLSCISIFLFLQFLFGEYFKIRIKLLCNIPLINSQPFNGLIPFLDDFRDITSDRLLSPTDS